MGDTPDGSEGLVIWMERLTGRTKENRVYCGGSGDCLYGDCYACPQFHDMMAKLAHYEDLEEAGRLVELPCKVGETVYEIYNNTGACLKCDYFEENPYEAITWCGNENRKETENFEGWNPELQEESVCEKQFMDIREKQPNIDWIFNNREQFGKTVFLTREEAEAALKGGGQE